MKFIVANWKMYLGVRESTHLAERIRRALPKPRARVVICPSFPALWPVGAVLRRSPYHLGAQDLGVGEHGAATGEVSGQDLRELNCAYVLVGHSERRAQGESNELIQKKFESACSARLWPILCLGETLAQHRAGQTVSVIRKQLSSVLIKIKSRLSKIIVADEPVWAIGTGRAIRPSEVIRRHRLIREFVTKMTRRVKVVRVLYGGSLTSQNIRFYLAEKEIDGLLIGGASAKPSFVKIIKAVR